MNVLLTGPTGIVGRHALDQLLSLGYHVTVIELKNQKTKRKLKPYKDKIKIIWGNVNDKKLVTEAVKNKEAIIHLASIVPPFSDSHPGITKQVNYYGTKNIIDAIKKHNKKCFLLFASSISVYGDRLYDYNISINDEFNIASYDTYAKIKKETEDLIINSDINYTIFRITAIMDIPKIDPLMFHMPLDTKIEIVTAIDAASAFVNSLKHLDKLNKNIYNLGGGEKCRTTYKEFIQKCFKIYGLSYNHINEKAFATHNFHCGYYTDGEILNNIVHFRSDTLDTYYDYLKKQTNPIKKALTKLTSYVTISILNYQSEPRRAFKSKNKTLMKKFFK